jgi:hypothetical protein
MKSLKVCLHLYEFTQPQPLHFTLGLVPCLGVFTQSVCDCNKKFSNKNLTVFKPSSYIINQNNSKLEGRSSSMELLGFIASSIGLWGVFTVATLVLPVRRWDWRKWRWWPKGPRGWDSRRRRRSWGRSRSVGSSTAVATSSSTSPFHVWHPDVKRELSSLNNNINNVFQSTFVTLEHLLFNIIYGMFEMNEGWNSI